MPKTKNIVLPAVLGFALSFLTSVVCTHKFGHSLLLGLFFCLMFAAIALVVDFVWGKFLDGDSASSTQNVLKSSSSSSGNFVDITIDDGDLSNDGNELAFEVNHNHFKLSKEDTKDIRDSDIFSSVEKSSSVAAPGASAPVRGVSPQQVSTPSAKPVSSSVTSQPKNDALQSGFQPVTLGMPVSSGATENKPAKTGNDLSGLPDMGDFDNGGYAAFTEDTGITAGSGFSDFVDTVPTPEKGKGKSGEHDAATMASAIRTILNRDE